MASRRIGKAVAVGVPVIFAGSAAAWRWKNHVDIPSHSLLDLKGRNVVLTGATSGVGRATAELLLKHGAHVIIGSRDATRGQALCEDLRAFGQSVGGSVEVFPLDLAQPRSIADFVVEIRRNLSTSGVHAFINSAAEIRCDLEYAGTGVEISFATNHLGPQQLIESLLPQLQQAASSDRHARIVLVGSRLERRGVIDLGTLKETGIPDPTMIQSFDPMRNYAASKQANLLLAGELSKRLGNIDVFTVSPGMVHTGLWRHFPTWYRAITYPVRASFLRSPEEAARGIVYAVAAKEVEGMSGLYLSDGKCIQPSEAAQDEVKAAALFELCSGIIQRGR